MVTHEKHFHCRIPGEPRGQGRAKAFAIRGHAKMYKTKKDRMTESFTRQAVIEELNNHRLPIPFVPAGPVSLRIKAVHRSPSGAVRTRTGTCETLRSKKPDLDNIVKHVMDACNEILWTDDSQVALLEVSQLSSAVPRGGPPESGYLELWVVDKSSEEPPF